MGALTLTLGGAGQWAPKICTLAGAGQWAHKYWQTLAGHVVGFTHSNGAVGAQTLTLQRPGAVGAQISTMRQTAPKCWQYRCWWTYRGALGQSNLLAAGVEQVHQAFAHATLQYII